MTTTELYTKGAKIWVPHPKQVWEFAEVVQDYDPKKSNVLQLITESNVTKTLNIKVDSDLPPLCNPSILIGENDLTSLSYLHEPAVLYNLQVRFCHQRAIYTYCGIVLVAINPYEELPIYGLDIMRTYRGQAMGDLDPHVFAVAEEAYTRLEREQRHQSVVVSGESGAGKTVNAKYVMRYFATVSGSVTDETESLVEKKVLASSPIMEAIGNAKTTRNDNSSRFGKFIEIHFNKTYHILGASMRTYLLEKSRVVFQAPYERNYHIFYQLCAARNQLPHLKLDHQDTFQYLNQGENPIIDGVDDLATFEDTMNALTVLGFSKTEQANMFKILAGVLHLGNVKFCDLDLSGDHSRENSEGCGIRDTDQGLKNFAELLEISWEELRQWLCTRKITSMREVFLKPMTIEQAQISRDALAKHIYAELFNWTVHIVNKELESSKTCHKFIGVLDIYGFETFEVNSFEQFCINYANEKLQQQFNQHVFKLEQEEYIKEEIEWKMIDFYDNQPCIDLIEAKMGVLELLDEECRVPKGSDTSWAEKLYVKCSQYQHFAKPRFGNTSFIIHHFADNVQYESSGFLEKNRDTIIEEQISVLRCSQNKLLKKLFTKTDERKLSVPSASGARVKISASKPITSAPKANKKTVGSQFRDSLNMLMETLNATTPHYVRCIKPNDGKSAFEYNPERAVQQLRACGVLETVRISAAGFPSRWFYPDFFQRYRVLCRFNDIKRNDMRTTCEKILLLNIKAPDKYQFGKNKIFFRAGQVAYLEKLRAEKLKKCCIIVQSQIRAFIFRKRYLKIRNSILNLQRYGRGYIGRKLATNLRQTKAAITIQRYMRGWVKRVQFRRSKYCILRLQTRCRGVLARRRFMVAKYNAKAVVLQRYARGYLVRKWHKKQMRSIVICQSVIRRFLARRLYRKLRVEARSVEHVKKLNKGLENKIISLQHKIEELNKENNSLKNARNELNELKHKLDHLKGVESESKKLTSLLTEKEKQLKILEEQLHLEKGEKVDLIQEQEQYRKTIEAEKTNWNNESQKLNKEIENLKQIVTSNQIGAENMLKTRLEQEKMILMSEQDQERNAYQQLLREYNLLEQHCENLEAKITLNSRGGVSSASSTIDSKHMRSLSDVSNISELIDVSSTTISPYRDDDYGYGSVRTTSTSTPKGSHLRLDTIDWKQALPVKEETNPETRSDLNLLIKLQQKLKTLEFENNLLQGKLEQYERNGTPTEEPTETNKNLENLHRIGELEMENAKLLADLTEIREKNTEKTVMDQFSVMQQELSRRREEIIQFRSLFANQTANMKSFTKSTYGPDVDIVNEDGELVLAYEAQKKINQQLEIELTNEKQQNKLQEQEYKYEIQKLRDDNERQQKLLSANLADSTMTQNEAILQNEITRLTSENLDLNEKYDELCKKYRYLKKEWRVMAKKLKDLGALDNLLEWDNVTKTNTIIENKLANQSQLGGGDANKDKQVVIRKKERTYQGMFEYNKEDESAIIRNLIYELRPRVAVKLLPGLPSYIIFMCIRYTDYTNDDEKLKSLLHQFLNTVKKVIKKRNDDLETAVLWLANTLRFLHNLKQYSGEPQFQHENSAKQNEQCLKNFDLQEYRQIASDLIVWIYQRAIGIMEKKIQPLIVPAILEHEAISNIGGNKPGVRNRSASVDVCDDVVPAHKAPQALVSELTIFNKTLAFYAVDPEIINHIFRQLFFFICATALNNLLLRKEFCHWSKGCQIRYNLSNLEMWARDNHLDDKNIHDKLQPIIQAAHLLQARKTAEDVTSICDMCSALSAEQICKILQLYTPLDEYEERVPPSFIKLVKEKLMNHNRPNENKESEGKLLLDSKQHFPFRFPFNPSTICLEDIEIPEVLNLPMLKKI